MCLCTGNKRYFLSQNVEMNNKGILCIYLSATLFIFCFTSRAFTDDDDPMPSCGCYDDSQEGIDDEMPDHFHFHSSETGQMFSHFDDMFRSFDELFRSMGMTQFSAVEPGERY